MEHDDCLYIVVPAYNEESNIAALIDDWYPLIEQLGNDASRLLIVNDGSRDNTAGIVQNLMADRPLLELATKENGGHGPAVIYGYRHALDAGATWVFQTDSDGQTIPAEFAGFWQGRDAWDAIFGVRSNRQDGWQRKAVERVLCLVLLLFFGVRLPDANAPFRLMRSERLGRYLRLLPEDYNLPNAVLTAFFVRFGERVDFREVTFRPRQGGENSINIRKIFGIGWHALANFRALSKVMRAELRKR